jgi:hypothetical protein
MKWRKISYHFRESNPGSPVVAHRYTDSAIPAP